LGSLIGIAGGGLNKKGKGFTIEKMLGSILGPGKRWESLGETYTPSTFGRLLRGVEGGGFTGSKERRGEKRRKRATMSFRGTERGK